MLSTLCSMNTSPLALCHQDQKTYRDTKTVTSWTTDVAARRSNEHCRLHLLEVLSAWVRTTSLARDLRMAMATMIVDLAATEEIVAHQALIRLVATMTAEGHLLMAEDLPSDKTGREMPSEVVAALPLPTEICLHDPWISRLGQMEQTADLCQLAEERQKTSTPTSQATTADRRATLTTAEDEVTPVIRTADHRIETRIDLHRVIESGIAIEIEIVAAMPIRGARVAGVRTEREASGKRMRGERDCRTVSASSIDDEANVRCCSQVKREERLRKLRGLTSRHYRPPDAIKPPSTRTAVQASQRVADQWRPPKERVRADSFVGPSGSAFRVADQYRPPKDRQRADSFMLPSEPAPTRL